MISVMTNTAHRNNSPLKKTTIAIITALFLGLPSAALAAEQYPDLLTIPPSELQFDRVDVGGQQKTVLRFTNTVWNAGPGKLEMHGSTTPDGQTQVIQRIFDDSGSYREETSGHFVWHEAHNHWHFEKFAQYQLWTRANYEQWITNGRNAAEADSVGYKTTFCIRETQLVRNLPNTPSSATHTECGNDVQGLSSGWGDSYRYDLPEQWVEVGDSTLPDGDYVLRSVADPENNIKESPNNDPYYESPEDNEAITNFYVHEGEIHIEE